MSSGYCQHILITILERTLRFNRTQREFYSDNRKVFELDHSFDQELVILLNFLLDKWACDTVSIISSHFWKGRYILTGLNASFIAIIVHFRNWTTVLTKSL